MLTTLLLSIQNSWQISLLDLPSLLRSVFLDSTPTSTVSYSSDSSIWYTSTAQSGPCSFLSANAALAPHPRLQTFYLFPLTLHLLFLHPHHCLMFLAVSLYLLLPLSLPNSFRVLQWNAGGLRARSTELLQFISSHPVELIYIQESNLNLFSSFRIPGFFALRPDGTHSRSGIFFLLMSQTLAVASLFSSGSAYPSLSFLPPLFFCLTPTLIMQGSTFL